MGNDVLADLKDWLKQLVDDRPHRVKQGERPDIDIDLVSRAIAEIERLRSAEKR
jgi:hypothetical protein